MGGASNQGFDTPRHGFRGGNLQERTERTEALQEEQNHCYKIMKTRTVTRIAQINSNFGRMKTAASNYRLTLMDTESGREFTGERRLKGDLRFSILD